MELIWHIPGEAKEQVIWPEADVGRNCVPAPGHRPGLQHATAYILSVSGRFLRKQAKPGMPGLLFSGGALGLALQAAWASAGLGPLYIAVASPAQREKARTIGGGIVLEESDPGFTDRLKIETQGAGFPLVLAATTAGASIMKALGSASVLGRVFLLIPPGEPARVDLHSTINYKSLKVAAADIFGDPSAATDEELAAVIAQPGLTTLVDMLFGAQDDNGEKSGDWFEMTHRA
jgi:threonine dehydrogenase-like Zn-dependent dehydrogenase